MKSPHLLCLASWRRRSLERMGEYKYFGAFNHRQSRRISVVRRTYEDLLISARSGLIQRMAIHQAAAKVNGLGESPARFETPKTRRHRHRPVTKPNPYSHGPRPRIWPDSHRLWSSFHSSWSQDLVLA